MKWVRQHNDEGRSVVVAHVALEEGNQYGVRLVVPGAATPSSWSFYPTPKHAFEVADTLVRLRHGAHACSRSCSGWIEDADVR